MKIVVTGGAGFLGQELIRSLCERGTLITPDGRARQITEIISIDQSQPPRLFVDDRVGYVVGDIATPLLVRNVVESNTDAVFHLAAVPSGVAENDLDLGLHVNVEGTRNLLEISRQQQLRNGRAPKFVFASSNAVFGASLPDVITDDTLPLPQSSYGAQKLISEILLGDFTRKGCVHGRALRLPTVVVRPGQVSQAPASFISNLIREPLAGRDTVCPVPASARVFIASIRCAVANLIHAHELSDEQWGVRGGLNAPGCSVSVTDVLDAVRSVAGDGAVAHVKFEIDAALADTIEHWPKQFVTARADAAGFTRDASVPEIVRAYAAQSG
jgi:UDP-glucose 4-epimerase